MTEDEVRTVRSAAESLGFSDTELASKAGIDSSNLSKILRAKLPATPMVSRSLETVLKIRFERRDRRHQLQVLGWTEVHEWGWTVERLLDVLISLDYELIAGIDERHEGSAAQWAPVFLKNPDGWRVVSTSDREIQGYWSLVPLRSETFARATAGELFDGSITKDSVHALELPGDYLGYLPMIALRKEWRSAGSAMMFLSLIRSLERLAEVGIFFRELCVNACTPDAIRLCDDLGLTHVCSHVDFGEIYHSNLLEDPARNFLQRYPRLLRPYQQHSNDWRAVNLGRSLRESD